MESDGPMSIPIIAPELKINSNKVEDLQLCYSIQVPTGEQFYKAKRIQNKSYQSLKLNDFVTYISLL